MYEYTDVRSQTINHTYVHINVYVHIYIYIHIHAYIHIHIHIHVCLQCSVGKPVSNLQNLPVVGASMITSIVVLAQVSYTSKMPQNGLGS